MAFSYAYTTIFLYVFWLGKMDKKERCNVSNFLLSQYSSVVDMRALATGKRNIKKIYIKFGWLESNRYINGTSLGSDCSTA